MSNKNVRPVMLVIMDGIGFREETEGNAVLLANTPYLDSLKKNYPFTTVDASGELVGLPAGQMGNSEVGHLNIGAGRIVYQELTKIDMEIRDGSFYNNQVLNSAMDKVISCGGDLHLMGLVSKGGVHSQMGHIFATLEIVKNKGIKNCFVHCFLDGRDTLPSSGAGYVEELDNFLKEKNCGKIATIMGRFYAMDRDKRWERNQLAYNALVRSEGVKTILKPSDAIREAYTRNETDEFIKPIIISDENKKSIARIKDHDLVIFFNFRADRARQLTRAFTEENFNFFDVSDRPKLCNFVTMTRYDETFDLAVAFPPQSLNNILGEIVSKNSLNQLRISETEKYAHVTYFFNGGEEKPFEQEDRALIPSPREVPTYDHKPEMSAFLIADELLKKMDEKNYSLIVVNFANGDMVGHTGFIPATIKAVETVDACVQKVVEKWREKGGAAIITADHGNAEIMLAPDGGPATAHTTNPVPVYLVDDLRKAISLRNGKLGDLAPTILEIMGLEQPEEMTGKSIITS